MNALSLVTCEHASYVVPPSLSAAFRSHRAVLKSHRGFDVGAKETARELGRCLRVRPLYGEVSRLVIDLNRSVGHPRLVAPWVRALGSLEVERLLLAYYLPHRQQVAQAVTLGMKTHKRVQHVGIHSFTPELRGQKRLCDVGLLFDPRRTEEGLLARQMKKFLGQNAPNLRVRFNYPYLGISDGLTTALRRKFAAQSYLGLELEINQSLVRSSANNWDVTRRLIVHSLHQALSLTMAKEAG